jgi:glycosyltransferase involved in cell wall biosynthesis
VEALYCYTGSQKHFDDFKTRIGSYTGRGVESHWLPFGREDLLAERGCLFYPSPNMSEMAWNRRYTGGAKYSLCGVTHTTASAGVMDSIADFMIAPYRSWDAVVCTSTAVKHMVERLLEDWSEYLSSRLGHQSPMRSPVQLPVIPLGVEVGDFPERKDNQAVRAALRKEKGIADEDIAVLFMGRLSWHAKVHPYPIAVGMQKAVERTGRKAHLLLAGWFPNDGIEKSYMDMFPQACPDVSVHIFDGRKPEVRRDIWYAADIFSSLSDNVQETFGLTPIEAMAAGLPCVTSDWDGYRDTVRDGEDGFAIPTTIPQAGAGKVLARRYARKWDIYDRYIGYTAQSTAVDIGETARAFEALFANEDLRRRMGESGRRRAVEVFDWKHVVRQYRQLWSELSERRAKAGAETGKIEAGLPHPLRDDPFRLFSHYASQIFDRGSVVAATADTSVEHFRLASSLKMNNLAKAHMLPAEQTERLIEIVAEARRVSVASLAAMDFGAEGRLYRTVGWLYKLGVVSVEP